MHHDHAAPMRGPATSHAVPRGRRLTAHLAVGAMALAGSVALAVPAAAAPVVATAGATTGVASAAAPTVVTAPVAAASKPVIRRTASMSYFMGAAPAGMPGLTSATIVQDVRAKTLTATVRYAGTPRADDPSAAYIYLGRMVSEGCQPDFAFAVHAGTKAKNAVMLPSRNAVASTLTVSGATATVRSTGVPGTAAYTCAYVQSQIGQSIQQRSVWHDLEVERAKQPELDVVLSDDRLGATVGRWTKVRIRVDNDGDAAAKKVTVKLSGTGLARSPKTVKLGTIAAGKSRAKTVKVKLTRAKTRTLTVRATASGGFKDAAKVTVLPKKKTTKPKSLRGKLFWGADSSLDQAWQNRTVWFVDGRWAYTKIPTKGKPKCSAKVKGCVRYTYSAKTGKVKVGKLKGTVTSKALVLTNKKKKERYEPISIPAKGTKIAVNLRHQGSSGCSYGYAKTCYTYTWYLKLAKDGKFVQSSRSMSSGGVFDWYLGAKSGDRGRYRVLSKGRIELRYDSGKREIRTIGFFQDVREKASPQGEGLLLNGTKYYS